MRITKFMRLLFNTMFKILLKYKDNKLLLGSVVQQFPMKFYQDQDTTIQDLKLLHPIWLLQYQCNLKCQSNCLQHNSNLIHLIKLKSFLKIFYHFHSHKKYNLLHKIQITCYNLWTTLPHSI